MSEDQLGMLIGGAVMFLIMPTSLGQFRQKHEQLKSEGARNAMLKRTPDTSIKPRLLVIGAGLAAVWVAAWLVVLNV
ncbi:hypothetical protein [Aeromicrobium sp. Root472D3]|uniref:hypothetical protein n=1 Tax=Aeromicrobium sp. Root472D3 TaxID=1736540 RepID=UPI0006FD2AF6|nr:hypothetical protein [Aeromicrobium sp. Root472D3]KQX74353.1 hypothetical protein ASD10_03660 [Aeromicrobium sp. Root472D3]